MTFQPLFHWISMCQKHSKNKSLILTGQCSTPNQLRPFARHLVGKFRPAHLLMKAHHFSHLPGLTRPYSGRIWESQPTVPKKLSREAGRKPNLYAGPPKKILRTVTVSIILIYIVSISCKFI